MTASVHRPIALAVVIGAHVAGVYLISVNGLLRPLLVDPPTQPLQAFIPEVDPAKPPPRELAEPVRSPLQKGFTPAVERPVVAFDEALPPLEDSVTVRFAEEPGPVVADPPAIVKSTPLVFRERRSPQDFYPATSLRMGEEGATTIRVCVTAQGALQSTPTVIAGSGHARLDAAALTWAREALQFTPATQNGIGVDACKSFRVNFVLTR